MRASRCIAALVYIGLAASVAHGQWAASPTDIGDGTAVAAVSDGYYGLLTLEHDGAGNLTARRSSPVAAALWGGVALTSALDSVSGNLQVIASATDDGQEGGYFAWTENASTLQVHVARITATGATAFSKVVSPIMPEFTIDKDCHSPRLLRMASGVLVACVNDTDGVQDGDAPPRTAGVIELTLVTSEGAIMKRAQLMAMHPDGQLRLIPDGSGGAIVVWDVPPTVSSAFAMRDASATWAVRVDENLLSVWERIDDDPLYSRRDETASVASDGAGGLWVAGRKRIGDALDYTVADNGEFVMVNHLLPDGSYDWTSWAKALEWDAHEKRSHNVSLSVPYASSDVNYANYNTDQDAPRLVADGSGGVYVVAKDNRKAAAVPATELLYAQHLTSDGKLQWDANETGRYYSGLWDDDGDSGTPSIPVYNYDYGWQEGAIVQSNANPKQYHSANSTSWWGYDTFDGNVLNEPLVSVWAEEVAAGSWTIFATELDPAGLRQSAWGAATPVAIATGLTASPEVFTVTHERFGTHIVWSDGTDVFASHLNFFKMWDLGRVADAIGPGPDVFAPPPVTDLEATALPGVVKLTWTNPPLGVNADKPFDDFDGVMIIRTTGGPALSPYDFPEDAWRDAGPATTYKDYSVDAGVTYYYTAFAYDTEFAELNFSAPVWTSVRLGLSDVLDFQALGYGSSSIRLSWTNPGSPDFAGVVIYRHETAYVEDPASPPVGAVEVCRVLVTHAQSELWIDSDSVVAADVDGILFYSAFPLDDPAGDPFATIGARAIGSPVGGVPSFTAASDNASVSLAWNNPPAPAIGTFLGIVVCRAEGSAAPTRPDDGVLFGGAAQGGGGVDDPDVTNGTEYSYAAFAKYTVDVHIVYAVPATASATPADTEGPDPLQNFAASLTATNSIHLSWGLPNPAADVNTDMTGLIILRKVGSDPTSPDDPDCDEVLHEVLGSVPSFSTAYDDGTVDEPLLDAGEPYHYAAWTYDDESPPNYSTPMTTSETPQTNLAPWITAGPVGTATDHQSATVDWTPFDYDNDSMTAVVRWAIDARSAMPLQVLQWTTSAPISIGAASNGTPQTFAINNLMPSTTYAFEVTMTDIQGHQADAESGVSFTTDIDPTDSDPDGLPDAWETLHNATPHAAGEDLLFDSGDSNTDSTTDDLEDFDGDGLSNMLEYWFGGDPYSADTDADGFSDQHEAEGGTDLAVPFWDVAEGLPVSVGDGCASGGHAPLAWVLIFAAVILAVRRRRATEVA